MNALSDRVHGPLVPSLRQRPSPASNLQRAVRPAPAASFSDGRSDASISETAGEGGRFRRTRGRAEAGLSELGCALRPLVSGFRAVPRAEKPVFKFAEQHKQKASET